MVANGEVQLTVTDDSGLLAIVDAEAYTSFVDPDWTYEGLLGHFRTEMAKKTILVWECGDGGQEYRLSIRSGFTSTPGFRSAVGAITATGGALNLASYSTLTMAAQFPDQVVPARHEADAAFPAPAESVRVRIVQMYDPDDFLAEPDPHFIIEVEPGAAPPWPDVQWESSVKGPGEPPPEPSSPSAREQQGLGKLFRWGRKGS